jgi:hypothetical protein
MTAEVDLGRAGPSGLAAILGDLLVQNLARDPERSRLLRPAVVAIAAVDAEVGVTLYVEPGRVAIVDGLDEAAQIGITASSADLLSLTDVPLRFGLPDAFRRDGRRVLRGVLAGRVRIRGMMSHPRRLARLTMLLSVR